LQPRYLDALRHRADLLRRLERPAEALADYDAALAQRPDDAVMWFRRGNALLELERRDEAVVSYGKALALRQDFVEALNNRATALIDLD